MTGCCGLAFTGAAAISAKGPMKQQTGEQKHGRNGASMARKLAGGKLVIATHNEGKLREMRQLLMPFAITAVSAAELALLEPEETGATFIANAELKARAAAKLAQLPALADDSGLCVHALDGAPGIYSARWAGPERDFDRAMARVAAELEARNAVDPAERCGHFVSALTIAWPDGHVETVEGMVCGTLIWPKRGTIGFGYDPMFLPDGHSRAFGEMTGLEKHGVSLGKPALSHRARAFQLLAESCFLAPREAVAPALPL
jgi:XTP/dITP diphosphohydrolase